MADSTSAGPVCVCHQSTTAGTPWCPVHGSLRYGGTGDRRSGKDRRAPQSQEPVAHVPRDDDTGEWVWALAEEAEPSDRVKWAALGLSYHALYTHPPVAHPSVEEVEARRDEDAGVVAAALLEHEFFGPFYGHTKVSKETWIEAKTVGWRIVNRLASLRGEGGTT